MSEDGYGASKVAFTATGVTVAGLVYYRRNLKSKMARIQTNLRPYMNDELQVLFVAMSLLFLTGMVFHTGVDLKSLFGLDNMQEALLSFPDQLARTAISADDNPVPISKPTDDTLDRYLSSSEFEAKVKSMALQQLRPLKEELMKYSDERIRLIQSEISSKIDAKDEAARQAMDMRLNEINQAIESRLSEAQQALGENQALIKEELEAKINAKVPGTTGNEKSTTYLEDRMNKIQSIMDESEVRINKCCQKDINADMIVSDFVQAVMKNASQDPAGHSFNQWLTETFLKKADLRSSLDQIEARFEGDIKNEMLAMAAEEARKTASEMAHNIIKNMTLDTKPMPSTQPQVTVDLDQASNLISNEEDILRIIQEELRKYDADKTGMFDFALESAGGTIASTRCTETHDVTTATFSVFGIPFWWMRNSPRTILQPESSPGQCWAFKGSHGTVVVKLSNKIVPKAVSLEHIAKMIAPDQNISSAPKKFAVFGLTHVDDERPVSLGNFSYTDSGPPVQTFFLSQVSTPFEYIELKILSNHGHMVYTCLYRFRVHGQIVEP